MDQLAAQMNEEGQYITMVGSMTMESQNNWADAAVARQEEAYPNMTLVPDKRVADDSDAEKAYEITKQLIQKYPDLEGHSGHRLLRRSGRCPRDPGTRPHRQGVRHLPLPCLWKSRTTSRTALWAPLLFGTPL
jgi:hypothetical protein